MGQYYAKELLVGGEGGRGFEENFFPSQERSILFEGIVCFNVGRASQ